MNPELFDFVIRLALLGLCFFTAYLAIERLISLVPRRPADDLLLNDLTAAWRRNRKAEPMHDYDRLGWLASALSVEHLDLPSLWRDCDREKRDIERFEGTFPFVGSIGMALGLLGTFNSLMANANSGMDAAKVVGSGIGASMFGMSIALAATFCEWILRQRAPKLKFQAEVVLEALEEALIAPPMPPPLNAPSLSASVKQQVDTTEIGLAPVATLQGAKADSKAGPQNGFRNGVGAKMPAQKPSLSPDVDRDRWAVDVLCEDHGADKKHRDHSKALALLRSSPDALQHNGHGYFADNGASPSEEDRT